MLFNNVYHIFKVTNAIFDYFYPALPSGTSILDKLFQIVSKDINKIYLNWPI